MPPVVACVVLGTILLLLLSTLRSASGDAADDDAYITFGALRLANHSYVDVSGVMAADPDEAVAVVCHTHFHTCCSAAQGPDRGDWYAPKFGSRTPTGRACTSRVFLNSSSCVAGSVARASRDCTAATSPSRTTRGSHRERGCALTIPEGMSFSATNGANPPFTLSCISTGGPATTVSWTRDSSPLTPGHTQIMTSLLIDQKLAVYVHSLTLEGREKGLFACSVSNDKPSIATAEFQVTSPSAPTRVQVSLAGPGSLQVTWTPSTGPVTGYLILCCHSTQPDTLSWPAGPTDTSATISGLIPGATYSLSLVATSPSLPSLPSESVSVSVSRDSATEEPSVGVVGSSAHLHPLPKRSWTLSVF